MCHALAHAHAAGVIHCDLKPANILLDGAGAVRVADFGLARHLTRDSPWAAAVEGTAPFMAPEQAVGAAGAIDPRTDVYGLGAVLYALLTGQAPWTGRSVPEILARVIGDAPVVPPIRIRPDLAPAINDVCERCLAKPPRDRFGTIDDVRTALLRALG
jgi:serine/threonine protein kinase